MNWMDKLERKLGHYAVPNLSRYFVGAIVLGYLMSMVSSGFVNWIEFDVNAILHGQIWRLFSWIFMPTTSLDFFGLLFLLCVLMWGSSLESMLGTFRMNVFLWGGAILSDIGGRIIYVITKSVLGSRASVYLSTYYILMSMLLALAICMPEGEVRLYFVLPIKMKWMLVFELLYLAYIVFSTFKSMLAYSNSIMGWILGLMSTAQIIFAIANMFLFFWASKTHISHKQKKRQREFRSQFSQPRPGSGISQHKCVICGRTELTNPELQFRYCSKCTGNKEYCQDHLFTHTHM